MTVIDFSRPSPELCRALSRFYAARREFAHFVRDDAVTAQTLSAVAQEIHAAESAIYAAIEKMRVNPAEREDCR